ncbi:MAG: DUF4911 domain-containing protein [Bacillota bacterium]|nr:DUF4911 domain-containing protein [Bacillota bacterium]
MAISFLGDPLKIPVLLRKEDIVYLDRIMEGYGHLGFATSAIGKKGLVYIQVTADTKPEVLDILNNFPYELKILNEQEVQEVLTK